MDLAYTEFGSFHCQVYGNHSVKATEFIKNLLSKDNRSEMGLHSFDNFDGEVLYFYCLIYLLFASNSTGIVHYRETGNREELAQTTWMCCLGWLYTEGHELLWVFNILPTSNVSMSLSF